MARTSTIVWIVSAVVVVGAGVGTAVALPASSHSAAPGGSGRASATPKPSGTAASDDSSPSASATAATGATTSDPAHPSSPATAAATATPTATTRPVVVKSVTPHLTYYQWDAASSTLEVGGNVPGLVDAGGSCVVTATRAGVTVTQSFGASAQASSTECGTMRLTSPKLTSGAWNLIIGYRSPRATGTSAGTEVTL